MKICATTQNRRTAELWAELLRPRSTLAVMESRAVDVAADVVVMAGAWAFERYGGRPTHDHAQIVPNERGDGFPLWVAIPPYRPFVRSGGEIKVREDFASVSPAYFAIFNSIRAIRREFGDEVEVVLDLPLLGMDDPDDEVTPISVADAIEEALRE